jgi:iron(III) transport system permease protein
MVRIDTNQPKWRVPVTNLSTRPVVSPPQSNQVEPPRRGSLRGLVTKYGGDTAWYLFVSALALVVVGPVVLFSAKAFENNGAAIRSLPNIPNIGETLLRTLVLAVGSTAIAGVLAVVLALLVMRVPLRYRGVAGFIPQLPLIIPPVASIIGWIFIFAPTVGYGNTLLRGLPFFEHLDVGPFNVYSMTAIILLTGVDLTGIVFALVYARMHEVSGGLGAAARISGASALQTFWTVTLPLLRPSLVAALVIVFLISLGQFTAPLLLGTNAGLDVLTTEIFRLREKFPIDYATMAALGLPLLFMGVVSVLVQRAVIGDQRRYVTQGVDAAAAATTRPSVWAFGSVLAYGAITVVLPLMALTLVAFSPYWTGDLSSITFTTRHFDTVLAHPAVVSAITNSIVASVLAAAIVLPLGFIGALAMSGILKAPRPVHLVLDFLFVTPLAVPRAILGIAVLYVFIRPPFSLYGTIALFIIGYAFVVLPFGLRSQLSSLMGVHRSLFEAARVSGAGQFRTIMQIALPLTRRGMTASVAMMVILLSHDFAVSVMVRSPGNHVMGTILYDFWEGGVFSEVAVMALLMSAVTGTLLGLTVWLGGKSALKNL